MKILMVCLGNICRSPMAHGLLRKKTEDLGLDVIVDSAGTSNFHVGEAPDSRMRQTAKEMGCPIDDLQAREFVANDYDLFDTIFVMDASNYNNVTRLARNEEEKNKVKFILNETFPNENRAVPDPYYGGEQGFIEVYNLLDEATDKIIQQLSK